jgi:hypothetical protein
VASSRASLQSQYVKWSKFVLEIPSPSFQRDCNDDWSNIGNVRASRSVRGGWTPLYSITVVGSVECLNRK